MYSWLSDDSGKNRPQGRPIISSQLRPCENKVRSPPLHTRGGQLRGNGVVSLGTMNLREMVDSVPVWYHEFEFAPGLVTPGSGNSRALLARINLPRDMSGLRVLDIGARDGFFSFECERRGAAEVVPIDYVPAERTGFPVAKKILGSQLNLVHENIYNLTSEKYGQFDIVLFLGVLYHLPDPMHALEIIFSMMKSPGWLFLETIVIDNELPRQMARHPWMRFYPGDSKNSDHTNYWGMTEACVAALLEEYDLSVISKNREGERGVFVATKEVANKNYYTEIARGLVR